MNNPSSLKGKCLLEVHRQKRASYRNIANELINKKVPRDNIGILLSLGLGSINILADISLINVYLAAPFCQQTLSGLWCHCVTTVVFVEDLLLTAWVPLRFLLLVAGQALLWTGISVKAKII